MFLKRKQLQSFVLASPKAVAASKESEATHFVGQPIPDLKRDQLSVAANTTTSILANHSAAFNSLDPIPEKKRL